MHTAHLNTIFFVKCKYRINIFDFYSEFTINKDYIHSYLCDEENFEKKLTITPEQMAAKAQLCPLSAQDPSSQKITQHSSGSLTQLEFAHLYGLSCGHFLSVCVYMLIERLGLYDCRFLFVGDCWFITWTTCEALRAEGKRNKSSIWPP